MGARARGLRVSAPHHGLRRLAPSVACWLQARLQTEARRARSLSRKPDLPREARGTSTVPWPVAVPRAPTLVATRRLSPVSDRAPPLRPPSCGRSFPRALRRMPARQVGPCALAYPFAAPLSASRPLPLLDEAFRHDHLCLEMHPPPTSQSPCATAALKVKLSDWNDTVLVHFRRLSERLGQQIQEESGGVPTLTDAGQAAGHPRRLRHINLGGRHGNSIRAPFRSWTSSTLSRNCGSYRDS